MSNLLIKIHKDDSYNNNTVIILFNNYIMCQLNKDKGIENIEIELFNDIAFYEDKFEIKMALSSFRDILENAKKVLINA